ncbi:MAG: DUF5683 domain-containing protein [Candidatus Aphodosoma sp.]
MISLLCLLPVTAGASLPDSLSVADTVVRDAGSRMPPETAGEAHFTADTANIVLDIDTSIVTGGDTVTALTRAQRRAQRQLANAGFRPNPDKSLWYALAFPGLGQIYNRKYWKLPIIYGGALGVVYAITWNGNKYSDYKRAYIDVTDSNPNTNYHLEVIPTGYPESSAETYVRNRMNTYRNYRDISIVVGVALYALTIIDAYVDAQLADFDVSPELSMKLRPCLETQPDSMQPAIGCALRLAF